MTVNKSPWIITAVCLAMILLLLFQVNWLIHSKNLIEEQFDQKVTMALCSAVESLAAQPDNNYGESRASTCELSCLSASVDIGELEGALISSLHRYDIDIPFQFSLVSSAESREGIADGDATSYCSSLASLAADQALEVNFLSKEEYVIQKMGLMTGSAIFILIFISILFAMTILKLIRQRQMNAVSVDFFNNMAHEFRTPLTNIHLALKLLKNRNGKNEDRRYFDIIENESNRLTHQVERMLHVAKLENGEYQLSRENLRLGSLIMDVVKEMQIQASEKKGLIRFSGNTEPAIIHGDPLHLSNAIRNLIDNGMKYNKKRPLINISLEQDNLDAVLTVQDNGIGLSEKQKSEVFERFRRIQNGNLHNEKGFGLGLTYVKRVIELHRGKIELISTPGVGSKFIITIPQKGQPYVN